ncbi:hypothetical protein EJ04DRAFT_574502 [Polyplosphaeria fusca]|uniref:Uncharacterized protein n=1 Tax=Polyplosphaeria fusca TaxID=682080 RepID=A0A9P4R5V0_9PLEO|nr:hypothetical protein EJ04DRAFT_574502 [Polyplosphaeria fusca]
MPPKRDIRDFFKPAQHTQVSTQPQATTSSLQWPLSRARVSQGDDPTRKPVPSYSPPYVGANSPAPNDVSAVAAAAPPPTSQSSTYSTSSKRVVVNGQQVVQDSDSDSDSDFEELIVLDFGKKVPNDEPLSTPRTRTSLRGAPSARSSIFKKPDDTALCKPPDRGTIAKPSLSRLIQIAQRTAEAEQRIAIGKANLENAVEDTPIPDAEINEDVLAAVVNNDDDSDNAARLYLAMQRTSAPDLNCVVHIFPEAIDAEVPAGAQFPIQSLPRQGWAKSLENSDKRDQAFMSGFAQQIFRYQVLPEELVFWMLEQLTLGASDALGLRYLQLIEAHPESIRLILSPGALDRLFSNLNADTQLMTGPQTIQPSFEDHDALKRKLPTSLGWVIRLMQQSAQQLSTETSAHALYLSIILSLDESVISDPSISQELEMAIETLICSISVSELTSVLVQIVPRILQRITHPVLQNKLVRSLPARSPLTASLQRYVALSFFLHPVALNASLNDAKVISLVHSHLQSSSDFRITKETDYKSLATRLSLLDIGIGPGLGDVPYHPLLSSTASQEISDGPQQRKTMSPQDKAFNREVDSLARHIKYVSNNIVEAGAIGDLTRLDAKDASERLFHRLENVVRIGGRPKKEAFGKSTEHIGSQSLMSKWAALKTKTAGAAAHIDLDRVSSDDGFEEALEN